VPSFSEKDYRYVKKEEEIKYMDKKEREK
jgi:hypothetical protein